MNVLHSIVNVSFSPVTTAEWGPAHSPSVPPNTMKIVSCQFLTFRLTVTYDNMAQDTSKEQAAKTFLSMLGVHSLEAAWPHLFGTVQVVPFLLCKRDSSARLQSEKASSPSRADSLPNPPSSSERCPMCNGSAFVRGTPRFWSNRRYTSLLSDATARKGSSTPLHGSTTTELPMPGTLPPPSAVHSLPTLTATASPSLASNSICSLHSRDASADDGDACWDASSGVRCEAIGSVLTVAADEELPRRLPAEAGAAGVTDSGLPHWLESRYTIELALPDFEMSSLRGHNTALAMVVLLPLCSAGGCGGAMATMEPGDQPSIMRSVLARSVGQTQVEVAAASALVLGTGVVPVQLTEPFMCVSSTSPLSNGRLVLNLSLTNVTASAARLYSTSFDLHSSCVLPHASITGGALAGTGQGEAHITTSSLWGEMRPGANLSSMRTIDLLTKLVTITPVVVGQERLPVVLYPGETYSFEFVIEVLPQLCYLLNSQSLEYLYERYYAAPHGVAGRLDSHSSPNGKSGEGGSPRSGAVAAVTATFAHGPLVTDCYGQAVSAAELRGILSYSYMSNLFVYYDLAAGNTANNGSSIMQSPSWTRAVHSAGLCLRHPARWSFGV
ncbi:hypothetical protein LSCM1_06060 [Leishmania martiniquensis]|uniref:Uncharacterized protein n=1 Tax=Leishmania martiniquensis TaxID=1580590 RepID=A0A836KLE8_9TRYP|nr:hypothetical protein LSCM1_06060 [Leishmania martiniquensis]